VRTQQFRRVGTFSVIASQRVARMRAPLARNDEVAFVRATKQPDGQISKKLSSPQVKNIPLKPTGKSTLSARPIPPGMRGRFAIVTNVRRDAVDAVAMQDERGCSRTAKPCGPGAPMLASSFVGQVLRSDGGKKAGHRGDHEVSRKTTAQGRPDCLR